jgi:putative flippase GtrA
MKNIIAYLTKHVIVRFIISGGTGATTDLILLYILNTVCGIQYLLSSVLAFLLAFCVSFTLHKFWTFKSHEEETHKQVALYLCSSLFGLCLNTLFMYIFVGHFHIAVMLSQIFAGALVACSSFFISRTFVFKYKKEIHTT